MADLVSLCVFRSIDRSLYLLKKGKILPLKRRTSLVPFLDDQLKQHDQCFAPLLVADVRRIEKVLAQIRMPFAKQVYRGKNLKTIKNEASIAGVGSGHTMIFIIEGVQYDAAALIKEVEEFFQRIQITDVLNRMPD